MTTTTSLTTAEEQPWEKTWERKRKNGKPRTDLPRLCRAYSDQPSKKKTASLKPQEVRSEKSGSSDSCNSSEKILPCTSFISFGQCSYRDHCSFSHDPRLRGNQLKCLSRDTVNYRRSKDVFHWPSNEKSSAYYNVPNSRECLVVRSMWYHFLNEIGNTKCTEHKQLQRASEPFNPFTGKRRLSVFIDLAKSIAVCLRKVT